LLSLEPDIGRIRGDVETLAAMTRSSARAGELHSAGWLAQRLAVAGIEDVRVERYRYQRTYALAHALHSLAGIAALARGGIAGAAAAAAVLGSYEAEASGRCQWIRRFLPGGDGANVVARIPAVGRARATLVLVAHHDAANTGAVWHPAFMQFGARRHVRRRRVDPFMAPVAAALAAGAAGCALPRRSKLGLRLRAAAAAVLATSVAADADVARSPTVPGASDNASGVAVGLELARALSESPAPDLDVILHLCGTEEAGMGGMAAFIREHGDELGPSAFVLGLDTLGAGTPIVASAEGPMREHRYPSAPMAVVDEGAAIAGEARPERWRIGGWTDPVLAVFAGIPAVSVLSMGPGYFPHYHRATDVPETVDWRSVQACARIAAGSVQALGRRVALSS
jgi:hypothetical protein